MRLQLGTMNFGSRTDAKESALILHRALDLGVVEIDTANMYGSGESERIIGEALGARRSQVKLATKVGLLRNEGLSREAIRKAIDASLQRLRTDYIDVYYLHAPDRKTPIEASLAELQALLAAGKIRSWGVSNYAAWEILEMIHLCDRSSMARPVIAQQIYNLLIREIETEYLPFARKYALQTTVFNPLAGGLLAGRAGKRFEQARYKTRYLTEPMQERVQRLQAIATREGLSLLALAYGWLHGRVDAVICGPAQVSHLEDAVRCREATLPEQALAELQAMAAQLHGTDTHYVR